MDRIWIAGNAGSGKTTLAGRLGGALGIPVYHRDSISWRDDFSPRPEDEQIALTKDITASERWIFEGARFTAAKTDGRLDRCDVIVHLEPNRVLCAYRVFRRARSKAGRADLSALDQQPCSVNLLKYVLWEYPGKRRQREAVFTLAGEKGIQVVKLRMKRDIDGFLSSIK